MPRFGKPRPQNDSSSKPSSAGAPASMVASWWSRRQNAAGSTGAPGAASFRSRDRRQPGLRLATIDRERRGLDGVDTPPVSKEGPDLRLGDAARSPIARLPLA